MKNPHSREIQSVRTMATGLNADRQPISTARGILNPYARGVRQQPVKFSGDRKGK